MSKVFESSGMRDERRNRQDYAQKNGAEGKQERHKKDASRSGNHRWLEAGKREGIVFFLSVGEGDESESSERSRKERYAGERQEKERLRGCEWPFFGLK